MKINNMPEYAKEYTYIVVIEVGEDYWFYGAYNDEEKACKAANECDGWVFSSLEI